MPILLILQRVLSARQIRVNMEVFASILESILAVARMIILEKPANVSFIAVMYNYNKIYFHNLLHSENVTFYSVVPFLYLYISMCHLP